MCDHHIDNDATGLCCTRTDEHESGHCYQSTSGIAQCPKEEL